MATSISIPVPKLPPEIPITPVGGPIDLSIAVPGSKSITNRALILGALADGGVTLTGALFAEDTHYMMRALKELGFRVESNQERGEIRLVGQGGKIPAAQADLNVGNAGTAMRFLSAFLTLGRGRFRIDGSARMRERPIKDLIDGLQMLGVDATTEFDNGCPPVIIQADGLPGGKIQVDASRSSQYISAVLMAAPYAKTPLEIEVTGEFVSRPFVDLTLKIMADFGVGAGTDGDRRYMPMHKVSYRAGEYPIEGDATAATYFLAAAAILGGRACVTNLSEGSAQGDAGFAAILQRMGCSVRMGHLPGGKGIEVSRDPRTPLQAVSVDLNDMPDVVQTLAVVALFAQGTTNIINVGNLRIKETDRLKALSTELTRLGAHVVEGSDDLEITPGPAKDARIETYNDHRMAMALALVGLGRPGVTILDPVCVGKTYPNYFTDLEKVRASKK